MAKKEDEKPGTSLEVQKPAGALALPDDLAASFDQDVAELGANYSADQLAMPFLTILQALSPQVTKGKTEFVEGAQAGMLYDTVTKQLYDGEKGVNLILGTFKDSYIEWIPRNKGGGFVAEYTPEVGITARVVVDPDNNRVIQEDSPVGQAGNHLSLTHTRLGVVVSDDFRSWDPVIISMSASGLSVSSALNMRHKKLEYTHPVTGKLAKGPPMPFVMWRAKAKFNTNDKGSWYTWDIDKVATLNELPEDRGIQLYREIREFVLSTRGKRMMDEAARAAGDNATVINGTAEEVPF